MRKGRTEGKGEGRRKLAGGCAEGFVEDSASHLSAVFVEPLAVGREYTPALFDRLQYGLGAAANPAAGTWLIEEKETRSVWLYGLSQAPARPRPSLRHGRRHRPFGCGTYPELFIGRIR